MTGEQIAGLVSLVGGICGVWFGIRSGRRADDQKTREDALSLARIEGKLDSVKNGVEEMRVDVRAHGGQLAELSTRVTRCEESVKSAHHRIDRSGGREEQKGAIH